MRTKGHKTLIMGLMFLVLPHKACPQNTDVVSSLNMGFGKSQAVNTQVTTVAGEGLAGLSEGENTRLIGGFIAVVHQNQIPVAVEEFAELPSDFALQQNYPNPFNPITTIKYGLPYVTDVHIAIYDIRGRKLRSWQATDQTAGWYTVQWNGISGDGHPVGTGVYFCRVQAGHYVETIKMVYLK